MKSIFHLYKNEAKFDTQGLKFQNDQVSSAMLVCVNNRLVQGSSTHSTQCARWGIKENYGLDSSELLCSILYSKQSLDLRKRII